MNRWNGTGHLTRDPELRTIPGSDVQVCDMRLAVEFAGKNGEVGSFDLKCFEGQAVACAEHLKAGRAIAVDGRLRFEEWRAEGDSYRSRVYVVAERVDFLGRGGRRDESEAEEPTGAAEEPAAVGSGSEESAS